MHDVIIGEHSTAQHTRGRNRQPTCDDMSRGPLIGHGSEPGPGQYSTVQYSTVARTVARTGPRCNREILLRQTSDWISAFDGFCDQSWWFIIDDVISPVRDSVLILNLLWEPNQIVWTEITVHYHYLEFSSSFSSDGENWIFIISLHHSSQDFHLIPS